MRKKIVFLPYDMDTAIGINNEGALVFSYNLEDIDQTAGGADVFNGQQSVLWKNMRAAFFNEMNAMYQTLRSTGAISYEKVEQMFEEHQGKWPEAIFNEDAWFKYLAPLVEKGNASYLSMLQGSKAEQRKWWLYNRFRYIDSKYNAGDSLSDVITVRGYAKADITVEPYADVYASIKYGSYLVQARSARNTQTTLPCPLDNVNDTEIYIYSASQLASVGDLSGLMVGYADFSKAVKLQSLKIGDASASYSNGNLTELYLGNNELLRTIDVRNCPLLSQAVDISGCRNIEHIYFDGTAITGLDLPKGGIIKTLHLPGTLTNLSVIGHSGITDFVLPSVENLSTCRLEHVGDGINTKALLSTLPSGCRVRLIGFDWTVANETELTTLKEKLDAMRGLNENGGNEDTAQLYGTIHITNITGAVLKSIKDSYPDITIEYTNLTSKCYYYNYDGTVLLYTATATNGSNVNYRGSTPTKPSTISQNFTFFGWAREIDGERDLTAQSHIVEDRYLYAVFEASVRTYTVKYYVGSRVIQTKSNVPYGSSVYYDGETPTNTAESDPSDYQFTGWDVLAENIQGNVNCYAQFRYIGALYKHLMDGNLKGEVSHPSVTAIADYGFDSFPNITKVSFPEVLSVGTYAFEACSKLEQVSLPKVTYIGTRAFSGMNKMTSLEIPSVITIDDYAFGSCSKLTTLNIPNAETIGQNAFYYCSGLTSVNMQHVKTIKSNGFQYCTGLMEITLPDTIEVINGGAFRSCTGLTKMVFPAGLKRLDSSVFTSCTGMRKIIFLGRPTTMYNDSLSGMANLEDVYVPWRYHEESHEPWGTTNATIHYIDEGWMDDLESILAD